jgi:GH35 family endo-1,4-beta-xylanase
MNLIKKRINMSFLAISVALSLTGCDIESSTTTDKQNIAEIINGSFEADAPGETPTGNWEFRESQDASAVSTIEVIESAEGVDSYKGTKAVRVMVETLGTNNWDVEVAYEDLPVIGGKTYEFSIWIRGGAVGTNVDFYIQTPEYAARSFISKELTGEWQEIKLTAKAEVNDTLLRLAAHFSKAGNINTPIYLDEFTGVISNVPDVVKPEVEYSAVDVKSLKALTELNVGVAVPAGGAGNSILNSEDRQAVIELHFNQLSAENIMKPEALHPVQGAPFFDDADALVNYAKENSMTLHGHVFVWHSQIPGWMRTFEGDKAAWITMMEDHIKLVASHFEEEGDNDTVTSWDVVNEAFNENGSYRGSKKATNPDPNDNSVWYENIGEEFLPLAFEAARAADPDADLYYNDYNLIWNEVKLDAVIKMVNDFEGASVPIDGIGFQSHISVGDPSIEDIRKSLQNVVDNTTLKVKITELDVRMNNVPDSDTPLIYLTSERADEQKQYYHDIVEAYLDIVPAERRGGITVWGAIDGDSWLQSWPAPTTEWPLLFNNDYTAKPALQGFADALSAESGMMPLVPVVANADFEDGLGSWGPRGDATITLDTTQSHTGSNSALVAGRTATWQGISKSVVGLFIADQTYNVSAWVKLSDDASTVTPDMKLTLEINHGAGDGTTEYLEMTTPVTVTAGEWVELTGIYVHKIASEANSANLYVEGSDTAVDFYVDDISVTVAE